MFSINPFIRKIKTAVERSVAYKRQRWALLTLVSAFVSFRVIEYEYLGLMYFLGLYIIYLIVLYFTPSGLPDPDEDEF
jgi:hypothetical protein